MDAVLLFDVEDVFSPPDVGSDDSIMELAQILTEEGLRGNFLYIGDRALLLKQRRRHDVIDSMAPHDVGLHTLSAQHPCGPEYVAGKDWAEGLAEALRHERKGVQIIEDVFGRRACALSTHWFFASPHAQRAAALLELPYVYAYPSAPPLYTLSWYAGALGIPWFSPTLGGQPFRPYFEEGFDDSYHDRAAFNAIKDKLDEHIDVCLREKQPFLALLLYHPARVRLIDHIDCFMTPNGLNRPRAEWGRYGNPRRYTPQQVRDNLANFRELVRWIRTDPRLNVLTVSEVARKYGRQPDVMTRTEILEAATAIHRHAKILLHDRFSPAEILAGLAEAVLHFDQHMRLPETVPRHNVMGPSQNLIVQPEVPDCSWDILITHAKSVIDQVRKIEHLPTAFGPQGQRVGINHLYAALAASCLAAATDTVPDQVTFRPMPRYPDLAVEIGRRFIRVAEGDNIDPDLDVDALFRHGKLQTWTLKPAMLPGY